MTECQTLIIALSARVPPKGIRWSLAWAEGVNEMHYWIIQHDANAPRMKSITHLTPHLTGKEMAAYISTLGTPR